MADEKGEPQRPNGLTCPLCLEAFKIPTLLRCGHTFCKVCLQHYDERHNAQEHMECPVCRKRTKLDEARVAGLSPNFSVVGLQDDLKVAVDSTDGHLSANFCRLHRTESRNIYCEVCEDLICLTCLIENHQGHKILKKEMIEEELRKEKVALMQKGYTRKNEANRYVRNAQQEIADLRCKLFNMEKVIEFDFSRKVSVLHENHRELLQKVQSLRVKSDKVFESCISGEKQLIDKIESFGALVKHSTKNLDADMLKAHRRQCVDFGNALRKTNDKESIAILVQATANAKFHPSDEKLLSIGHVQVGLASKTRPNDSQHSSAGAQKTPPNNIQRSTAVVQKSPPNNIQRSTSAVQKTPPNNIQRSTSAVQKTPPNNLQRSTAGVQKSTSAVQKTTQNNIQSSTAAAQKSTSAFQKTPPNNFQRSFAAAQKSTAAVQKTPQNNIQCSTAAVQKPTAVVQKSTAVVPNQKVDPMASRIPIAVPNNAMTIVKTVEIPGLLGMAAQSGDAVVVGGSTIDGADTFFVSGEKKTYLSSAVGTVYDITFLKDGSTVASHGKSVCRLYDARGLDSGVEYRCKEGDLSVKLYSDKNDDIYAVNGNPEVYVFHGRNSTPQRIVHIGPTFDSMQICVTSTGTIITSTTSSTESDSYTSFDQDGMPYNTMTTREPNVFTFVTLDSQDRLLVAKVKRKSYLLRLARYTLCPMKFPRNNSLLGPIKLPHVIDSKKTWCYMASLTPNMLAFANGTHLYFINLGLA